MRPILTEKSLHEATRGQYAFWVPVNWTKYTIKLEVSRAFGVHVTSVKTANKKMYTRRNVQGRFQSTPARKRAMVTLKGKEKIALFESDKK